MAVAPACRIDRRNLCKLLVLPVWISSLTLGILTARYSAHFLTPMVQSAVGLEPTFPALFRSAVLPFLLSAFAVFLSEPWLLLPICSMKAFGFGFCASGVYLAFGTAGWLVRFLFLFTDVLVIPILLFYCLRQLRSEKSFHLIEPLTFVGISSALAAVDYYVIAPFLVSIIDF